MSALKALSELVKTKGIYDKETDSMVYVLNTPIIGDEEILSVCVDNKEKVFVGCDNNGYLYMDYIGELTAYAILLHLHKCGEYIPSMPIMKEEEFNIDTFIDGLENLVFEVKKLKVIAKGRQPLDNDIWIRPAIALNVLMNDVQHYNSYIEKMKKISS